MVVTEALTVDIWSDLACPWCYIGKRKFEIAAERFAASGREVTTVLHSFELAPDTPVDFDGSEIDFLAKHKGIGLAQVELLLAQVTEVAASVGLNYDFAALKHTKTLMAHELLHLAKAKGVQVELAERLFKAYFEEGRHLGRIEELAELAAEVGLDRDEVAGALKGRVYATAVQEDLAAARDYGITAVPFFVIDGKYGVSGAQDPATFEQILNQVWEERAAAPA